MVLVCAVAFLLRACALDSIPPGICVDEGVNAHDALGVLEGNLPVYFASHGGREPLFIYMAAASIALVGRSSLSLRIPAVMVGVLTIPLTYWFALQLFATRRDRHAIGLLSSALTAITFWHLSVSRLGLRAVTLPLLALLAFGLLWRALRGGRWRDYGLAGASLGASQYTYLSARFLPVVFVVFTLGWLLPRAWPLSARRQASIQSREIDSRRLLPGLILLAVVALMVFLPLGAHFLRHPEDFAARAREVVVSDASGEGGAVAAFWQSMGKHLAMFVTHGDDNPRYNLPGRPVFGPITGSLALLGLALAAWRLRRPEYGFLWVVLLIMLLPAALTAVEIPHSLRSLGTLPAVVLFPAVALAEAHRFLQRRGPVLRYLVPAAAVVLLGSITWSSAGHYFVEWAERDDVYVTFGGDYYRAAQYLHAHPDEDVLLSTAYYRHPTLAFLQATGPIARQFDGRYVLVQVPASGRPLGTLIPITAQPPLSILERYMPASGRIDRQDGFSLYHSPLPWVMDRSLDVTFEDQVRLTGYSLVSGEAGALRLDLQWEILRGTTALFEEWRLYDVFVHLLDKEGGRPAQGDAPLWYPMVEWQAGDRVLSWHKIPLDGVEPGAYSLGVGLYYPAGRLRLAGTEETVALLGPFTLPLASDPAGQPLPTTAQ